MPQIGRVWSGTGSVGVLLVVEVLEILKRFLLHLNAWPFHPGFLMSFRTTAEDGSTLVF